MSRHLATLLLLPGFAVLAASPLAAEPNVWTRAVDHQLDAAVAEWADVGWVEVGDRYEGSLEGEDDDSFEIEVPVGRDLVIVGACDQDCSDIDLWAYAESDEAVAEDEAEDDVPILEVAARDARSGMLEIEVSMVDCSNDPCYWGIVVLAEGRSTGPARRTERPRRDRSQADAGSVGGPRVHALLVGIGDYPGEENDLAYTADDARRLQRALTDGAGMDPDDSILLVDRDATLGAFRRALERFASRVGSDDTFVLFFSGHGGRIERDRPQPSDPDSIDETLTFHDDDLTDDELAQLLSRVHAGRTLIVLDSCFSGGFAKDVISVPGRMGLFSSEEDVVSQVAAKFRAGGYLALFLGEGIGRGFADDGDNEITALELSQYVYERYRSDVKSPTKDEIVDFEDDRLGYQHLVVDRGSIAPSEKLFRLRRRR